MSASLYYKIGEESKETSFNVSNRNMRFILQELEQPTDFEEQSYSIEALLQSSLVYLNTVPANAQTPDQINWSPGMATMIECGLSEGYFHERIKQLQVELLAAKMLGATECYFL